MDTNPFANNRQQSATPEYLKPTQGGAGAAGAVNGVSNMVKALMAGDQKFRQQGGGLGAVNPNTTTGGPSVGAPMSLSPPSPGPSADVANDRAATAATGMVGASGMPGSSAGTPFDLGTAPLTNGGPFGAGPMPSSGVPMGNNLPQNADMMRGMGQMRTAEINNPFVMGSRPMMGMDPVSQALMSPIPGM